MKFDSLPVDGSQQQAPTPVSTNPTPVARQTTAQPSFDDLPNDQDTYGTVGQQAKTIAEGAAQGLLGPLAPLAETKLGIATPQDIRLRAQVNPVEHGVAEFGAFVAPAALSLGSSVLARAGLEGAGAIAEGANAFNQFTQAGVIGKLGEGAEAAAKAIGLGDTVLGRVGQSAIRGAFETALMQGGEELTKSVLEDPGQHAENVVSDIGLAGLLGGVLGGGVGVLGEAFKGGQTIAGKFVSQLDRSALEAGDFVASAKHSDKLSSIEKDGLLESLKKQKPNANEIKGAAERLGAPVMEGMISDHPLIQKAEDSLINGDPTYSAIARQKLYAEGYGKAMDAVNAAVGEGSEHSKAELGNIFKENLTKQIGEQTAPISDLYNDIKQRYEAIPLSERSTPAIARHIAEIPELKLSPSSPGGKIASRVMKEIEALKTVDDVKNYKTILNQSLSPTASSSEKHVVGILSDKLSDLEQNSIIRFAQNNMKTPQAQEKIMGLLDKRSIANKQYGDLMDKVKTLSEQLGKGRVYGPQDAINFIRDRLTPEEITQRLFSKNNSEFLKFFGDKFPNEMALMREYQKGALRQSSILQDKFSPNKLFSQVFGSGKVKGLEPEIQKALFSPEELQKLKDAKTYIQSFPPSFNPSGTAHTLSFRDFFKSSAGALAGGAAAGPIGAAVGALSGPAVANARDFAIDRFIKMAGQSPEMLQAMKMAKATINGTKAATKAATALFGPAKSMVITDIMKLRPQDDRDREKLQKNLDKFKQNPTHAIGTVAGNTAIPEYGFHFGQVAGRASQYLDSIKPKTIKNGFLDTAQEPTKADQMKYDRALDLANQPLEIIPHIKNGTLLPSDISTVKSIYPNWYTGMSQKIMSAMTHHVSEGGTIPYTTRQSLSMFLGQPLDSTMTPESIQSIQASYAKNRSTADSQPQKQTQKGVSKLGKLSESLQTPDQARSSRVSKG